MKYVWHGYIALVACTAIGTAWFATSGSQTAPERDTSALLLSLSARTNTNKVRPHSTALVATPGEARTTPTRASNAPSISALLESAFRDDSPVVGGEDDAERLITNYFINRPNKSTLNRPDESTSTTPTNAETAMAEAVTA